MIKKFFNLLLIISSFSFSQGILVNDTYSAPNLVDVLLNDPCVEISNISMSSGQSVAYFNQNASNFLLSEGVLIRNGLASYTAGQYTNSNISSSLNNNIDAYLQNLSNVSSGQTTSIVDVAFLEFDFTSNYNSFAFNFLFASNEYGSQQCISNDIFAFALTDLISGVTTNLAVIPGTTNPVTVKNIRNSAYNIGCNSTNPGYFSTYNVNNPSLSSINMRGHTVVMTAGSAILPNHPYKIRLSIADYGDSLYDSAVFIAGGSFTSNFSLGDDQTICTGDAFLLDTGLDNTYTIQWLQNGIAIPNENGTTYTVTEPGTYTVLIDKGACHIEDTIIFNDLAVNTPLDIYACDTSSATESFNLTVNNEAVLGVNDAIYDVFYYTSVANANSNLNIDSSTLSNFQSSGQTIYIKLFNTVTNEYCDTLYPFQLIINPVVNAGSTSNPSVCDTGANYNLSVHNSEVINGQTSTYNITYYSTENDAISASNSISSNVSLPIGVTSATYWIRIEDANNALCFDVVSVTITINPLPLVDAVMNIVDCSTTILPNITNGNYYTEPNGAGTNLGQGGATIEDGGTYYVFSGPDANGCTNQTSFNITFIDEYVLPLDYCGSFTVPEPPYNIGEFYTAPNGPNGSGSIIPSGTIFTNSSNTTSIMQPIYYYAEINGVLCRDELFEILIHPLPIIDSLSDVTYCDSFTLHPLSNGNYFTEPNGNGLALFAGNTITSSQTIYIYNELSHINADGSTGLCTLNIDFDVNIINTSVFTSNSSCGSYTLPAISFGNYYDQPSGQGNIINPNIPITTSQIVYYYANTTELPNCTDNLNYNITINPQPLVDEIHSATYCGEYVLPQLTNGTYYMLSGGATVTDQVEIQPNTVIDLSGTSLPPGTYYIYNGPDANGCTYEWPFTININPYPVTDEVLNSIQCTAYSIPTPTNGTIYTASGGPNGSGTVVLPTDVFNEDNTFYIYNEDLSTGCIVDNPFTVFYNGINLPDYQDVLRCDTDNFQLPPLTHLPPEPTTNYSIGYFYETGGVNAVPNNTIFNTPGIYNIYVYAVNNGRFGISCVEEDIITITISETPSLPNYTSYNGNYCTSFTLPPLPTGSFNVNYYSQPGGSAADIIDSSNYTFTIQAEDAPTTYDIWVYASATNNTNCIDEEHFQFTLYPPLNFEIPDAILCLDPITGDAIEGYVINSGLNATQYTAEWYFNNGTIPIATGLSYTALEAGTYTVVPILLITETAPNCSLLPTDVQITASSTAMASVNVTLPFEDYAVATVVIENGIGQYLYSLDDGPFQANNVFNNLSSGEHTIVIRDFYGNCGDTLLNFTVVKYPNFFTPNNDGYNDTWNIWDLRKDYPDAIISIFDRYGKLLKQISPLGNGWNGTYNNENLPSTDYWFTVDFTYYGEKKQFKANFSLKR